MIQDKAATFEFRLKESSITTVCIYNSDDILIRTLWSNLRFSQGNHLAYWDYKDDNLDLVPEGKYNIVVTSNNVEYEWEGVIGNSSSSFTANVHQGASRITDMTFSNNFGFYVSGYSEGRPQYAKFRLNDVSKKLFLESKIGNDPNKTSLSAQLCDSDDENVYWLGVAAQDNKKIFLFATNVNTDSEFNFANGVKYQLPDGPRSTFYDSVIDLNINDKNYSIDSLVVLKSKMFLFFSHRESQKLFIYNKITGSLISELHIENVRKLCKDKFDNLWVSFSIEGENKVGLYKVSDSGTIEYDSKSTISIENFPYSLAVNNENSHLLIADASQTIKYYNLKTKSIDSTFGTPNGYKDNPNVDDYKFIFDYNQNTVDNTGTFIKFHTDGSFWISDSGNYRLQHYSKEKKFLERIMYFPTFYNTSIDTQNASRLFTGWLEFEIDYSKKISPDNSSWILKRNWSFNLNAKYKKNSSLKIQQPVTLKDGKTYAQLFNFDGVKESKWDLVELSPKGLRFLGISLPQNSYLNKFGDIIRYENGEIGEKSRLYQRKLSNFKGDPSWQAETLLFQTPVRTVNELHNSTDFSKINVDCITQSGVVVFFFPNYRYFVGKEEKAASSYHLAGLRNNSWQWKTCMGTRRNYKGAFPVNGDFDIGNEVHNAGSRCLVEGNNIFWGYYGEFWQQGQTNKFNHYNDKGALIGQFGCVNGILGRDNSTIRSNPDYATYPGMAGNAYMPVIARVNNILYLYHNDESFHAGIHRWRISNLESIKEQNFAVIHKFTHGLTCEFFLGAEIDSCWKKLTKVISDANLVGEIPTVNKIGQISMRISGFLKPKFMENTSFEISTTGRVNLWVDDELIIDGWDNIGLSSVSGKKQFFSMKTYKFRLEYSNSKEIPVFIKWSSPSLPLEVIPNSNLHINILLGKKDQIFDLLEGLPYNSKIQANKYGWQFFPEQSSTDWMIYTDRFTYRRETSSSLYISSTNNAKLKEERYLTRNLLNNDSGSDNWIFFGEMYPNLDYDGETEYLDLLDPNNSVIIRIHVKSNLSKDLRSYKYYINEVPYAISRAEKKTIEVKISCINGSIFGQLGEEKKLISRAFNFDAEVIKPVLLKFHSQGMNNSYWGFNTLYFSTLRTIVEAK